MGLHVAHRKSLDSTEPFEGHVVGELKYSTITIRHRVVDEIGTIELTKGYDEFLQRDELFANNQRWMDPEAREIFKR